MAPVQSTLGGDTSQGGKDEGETQRPPTPKAHPEEFGGRREQGKKYSRRHRETILNSIYIIKILILMIYMSILEEMRDQIRCV
jgi:hypothetical protein